MTGFINKELKFWKTLPELIRQEREKCHLSVDKLSLLSGVSAKYIEIIESGLYFDLPGEMYTKQFIKALASFLKISPDYCLKLYQQEKSTQLALLEKTVVQKKEVRAIITPQKIRTWAFTTGLIALVAYLGWQVNAIFAAPYLEIKQPANQTTTNADFMEIVGQTESESSVTINDQEIIIQPNGTFQQTVNLKDGLNSFSISSAKKHSKKRQISLSILKSNPTSQAPSTPTF